jgi:hypothetical protein
MPNCPEVLDPAAMPEANMPLEDPPQNPREYRNEEIGEPTEKETAGKVGLS